MFRITHALSLGPFATAERAELLLAMGVTHVLNVSDSRSLVGRAFRGSAWVPVTDFSRIPDHVVVEALDSLHRMASEPGAHVYVHCMAGRQRGPTILWLYLIACGLDAVTARDIIESRSPDATAGYPSLIDESSVLHAQAHGLRHYLPLRRGEIITPCGAVR
jgi:hypothetical protein